MSNTPSSPTAATPRALFERTYDVLVYGAGCVGFAAARALQAAGKSVLLVESSGDVLGEISRSLENSVFGTTGKPLPAWEKWLDLLRERHGVNETCFDASLAEIVAASELLRPQAGLNVLLYAAPVSVTPKGDSLTSVTLATKSGFRTVRASQWIDATEKAALAGLCLPGQTAPVPAPATTYRNLLLQSTNWSTLRAQVAAFLKEHDTCEFLKSTRDTERRLRWKAGKSSWHTEALDLVHALRAICGTGKESFTVSMTSMRDFCVYDAPTSSFPKLPGNLLVLSPSLAGEASATPGDRYELGASAPARLQSLAAITEFSPADEPVVPNPAHEFVSDVVVAGTGTAGAVAAIAAGRQGVKTLAIDTCTFPGGVGTGGGIVGYFEGKPGGMQEEINERSAEISILFTGLPKNLRGWHHDAKKIALLEFFEKAGVTFLGDTTVCAADHDSKGHVSSLLAVVDGRPARIRAQAFVDSTGDGDVAVQAGAEFISGRPGDSRTLSYSQVGYRLRETESGLNVFSWNYDAGWVDATDAEDLSHARLVGIAQYLLPDWRAPERALAVAPLLGLRQSRHIVTDRLIGMDDLVGSATFEDSLGAMESCADTHSVDFEFESDDMQFYYWVCRCFRNHLHSDMPYRMILPKGLSNVWVASRASGITVDAAYALRMQRDLQRLGEAAGVAAGLSAKTKKASRDLDFKKVQTELKKTHQGSFTRPADSYIIDEVSLPGKPNATPLEKLDAGLYGKHLWVISRDPKTYRTEVLKRLNSPEANASFYAAAILAVWGDAAAEPRLLEALSKREIGPAPDPEGKVNRGAFGQLIDLPFWMLAVTLLRCCGTAKCIPALAALAEQPGNPFNVRTILALSLERLAAKLGTSPVILDALDRLMSDDVPTTLLPPSRSLWLTLEGSNQKKLINDRGADTRQDHAWQLHLIVARTRRTLGLQPHKEVSIYLADKRAYVRRAFEQVVVAQN